MRGSRRLRFARGWRIARVLLSTQYAYMLEYRAEIALWALSGVLPLIMLGVWSGSEAAGGLGLSPERLSRYFLSAFVVRQFTIVWLVHVFEEDALQGRLSPYLLQPLHPLWRYLASHLSEQATRLPFVVLIMAIFFLFQPAAFWLPTPGGFLLAVVAIHLAFLLRFLLQTVITMLCFWTERAAALERLLLIPYLFLSGLVAPLEAFPEGVRAFALLTPFPAMLSFPAQLLAGEPVDLAGGLITIGVWAALLLPLALWLWQAGLRRYSAMGA